ncbi:MAG: hypothetical protein R2717_06610 [Schumannella sp.]
MFTTDYALSLYRDDVREATALIEQLREVAERAQTTPAGKPAPVAPRHGILAALTRRSARIAG